MPGEQPLINVPLVATSPPPAAARHETVIPGAGDEVGSEVAAALAGGRPGLRALVSRHPALLEGWARLGELELAGGDVVTAYACARVAYHRGLDLLRRHGWGGTGLVRWSEPGNRGFLRGLRLLLVTAARLGEVDEAERCRAFLIDLDPDDALGVAAFPEHPGPGWTPPGPPD